MTSRGRQRQGRRRRRPPLRAAPALQFRGRDASWMVPGVLMLLIVLGDLPSSGDFRTVSWLVLVPVVASAICPTWVTACYGAVVIAGYVPLDDVWPGPEQMGAEDFFLVLVGAVLALPVAWLRERDRRRLVWSENVAAVTRSVVLRPVPPDWGGVESASRYLAADQLARVGGDFYDVLETPFGARVLLGDVQGKGLDAVTTASALVGSFRESGYFEADLDRVADRLEERIRRDNRYRAALGDEEEKFATGVMVAFPRDDPEAVQVVNFGHDGPLALGELGVRRLPDQQGPPLGLASLAGRLSRAQRVPFGPGETLLLCTDGVTEARDREGRFLPLRERLEERFARGPGTAPRPGDVVDAVERAVREHTRGRLTDDTAILAVRRLHPDPPPDLHTLHREAPRRTPQE